MLPRSPNPSTGRTKTSLRQVPRCLALLLGLVLLGVGVAPHSEEMGIDVSHWQGDVDWKKVQAHGIKFAFVKATEGLAPKDPKFDRNWKALKDVDLIRGAYHFLDPTIDGRKQARHFLATVNFAPGDIIPVVDVERLKRTSNAELHRQLVRFLDEVKTRTGLNCMIYVSPAFWKEHLAPEEKTPRTNHLWVAAYEVKDPPTIAGLPAWSVWQYTRKGKVPGVAGETDRNRSRSLNRIRIAVNWRAPDDGRR